MANLLKNVDYTAFVGRQESQYMLPASEFTDPLLEMLRGDEDQTGQTLPWISTFDKIRFRPAEVTLWAGISGHGKSHIAGQVIAGMLTETKALIASMEIKPKRTLYYMLRQISGGAAPSEEFARYFTAWTDDRLWLYDQIDTVEHDRIIGMIWYAATQLGIKHIVIDSLMKCGINEDDYNAQKNFVDHLCWACKSLNIHVHLIAHIRKTDDESKPPGKWDVLGSSNITNLVDNIIIVHRNKRKEAREVEAILNAELEEHEREPDSTLAVVKQRHGEWEGKIPLWYDRASQALTERHGRTWKHPLQAQFMGRARNSGASSVSS